MDGDSLHPTVVALWILNGILLVLPLLIARAIPDLWRDESGQARTNLKLETDGRRRMVQARREPPAADGEAPTENGASS